jgi:hypothetical protein
LDFNAVFERVSHVDLLYKLRYIGLSGSIVFLIEQFSVVESNVLLPMGATES